MRDRCTLVLAAAILAAVFAPLWTFRLSPVGGDYREQHVPWAAELSRALAQGRLPWWTDGMLGGFPLIAEGQIGGLSPLRWAVFAKIPFPVAYQVNVLLHILIALIGMERYLARLGIAPAGRAAGVLMFALGTPYAGFFYSVSWGSLAWFPWMLWGVERVRERADPRGAAWLGLFLALSWLGGFAQLALYASGMTFLYAALRIGPDPIARRGRLALLLPAGFAAAALCALPQVMASRELAAHSTRAGVGPDFANAGSAFPACLATFLFPDWQVFLQARIYLGLLPWVALPLSWRRPRIPAGIASAGLACWILAGVSLVLALGSFTPVWPTLVRLTGLHEMRVPAKFLFFAAFFAIPPLAHAFARLADAPRAALRACAVLLALYAGTVAASNLVLRTFRPEVEAWGFSYVERHIAGKPNHPHPLAYYQEKIGSMLDEAARTASPAHPSILLGFGVLLAAALWFRRAAGTGDGPDGKGGPARGAWTLALLALLGADLWVRNFHFTGFAGNWGPYETLTRQHGFEGTIRALGEGRLFPVLLGMDGAESHPLSPNQSMLHGLSALGGYSPLLLERPFAFHERLGAVNDSVRLRFADPEFLRFPGRRLVQLLGGRFWLAPRPIDVGLPVVSRGRGWVLYEDREALPRARWLPRSAARVIDPEEVIPTLRDEPFPSRILLLTEPPAPGSVGRSAADTPGEPRIVNRPTGRPDTLEIEVSAREDGFLVIADTPYSGWHAFEVGNPSVPYPLLDANALMRAIPVGPGTHRIGMRYKPSWRKHAMLAFGIGWGVILAGLAAGRRGW
ncbi:MAG: hypothetical protein HY608_05465 [Planctomycetes bacterium]|nr:hypothetical protein [Planctomycetota bacterium]